MVNGNGNGNGKWPTILFHIVWSGYPIQIEDNAITIPFVRFQENTNRFMNCYSSRVLSQKDFKSYHFLFSAKLDGSSSGSLTFEFDFDNAPEKDLVLITCFYENFTKKIYFFTILRKIVMSRFIVMAS